MNNNYRRLCDYNGYNNCDRPILNLQNYACSPGIGCHVTQQPVNEAKGVYSDVESCRRGCQTPTGKSGFVCSPNLGCHSVNEPPNQMKGVFSTWGECMRHCEKPMGADSYVCTNKLGRCHLVHAPPDPKQGRFANAEDCQRGCGIRPINISTYDCHPAKGGCIKVEDGSGRYTSLEDCKRMCKIHM